MDDGTQAVRIVADDRENAGGVIDALRRLPEAVVEVRRLACGDFLIGERIVVERKTAIDFAASVVDGRVFRQAERMKRGSRCGVLLIEGNGTGDQVAGVNREALQGALIHLAVFGGLAILRSRNPDETAHLLVYLGRQAVAWAHGALPRPGHRPKGRRARRLFVLQGFPRVGPGRAARLFDHFGSIRAIANASEDELAAVEGIGPVVARGIRGIVGSESESVPSRANAPEQARNGQPQCGAAFRFEPFERGMPRRPRCQSALPQEVAIIQPADSSL